MFRIMLLLCHSLIDTNTIPFYFSLSQIGRAEPRTQRFGLALSFRQLPYSFYESYTPGHLLDLRSHLVAWEIIYLYFADASARTSSDTASTWCVCGLKRFGEPFEDYLHFTNKLTHSTWCVCGKRSTGWTFFNS